MEPDSFQAAVIEQLAETRRHFDVIAEGLRADNRLLAEGLEVGLAGVRRSVAELRAEMVEGFTEVKSMIRSPTPSSTAGFKGSKNP